MAAFERLHPAVQYQVVHGLGFTGLRPVQELAAEKILDGDNAVILAPTAGGKTESAFLPLLSQMVSQHWSPISVLYISPIRALLNNQEARLERLARLVGRRARLWHGETRTAARRAIIQEPPDILLTTAESLEGILMSRRVPTARLFAHLQAVVVDEVHAFAGDDRGGHLMAVLGRLQRHCGRDIQRIGLSATVGNPDEIARWIGTASPRPSVLVRPPSQTRCADLTIDYVGTVENAAVLIERLHPGKKRLVFCDSRAKVERLGELLRGRGVETFVVHSALSREERALAEQAFTERSNCVVVATSTLELGLDIGDLDHVLQLDAPTTVASFEQRLGRTGRRPGATANCTFLCTKDNSLLLATALVRLHRRQWIESVRPPLAAAHLLAHQLMALAMQEEGVPTSAWWGWLEGNPAFSDLDGDARGSVLNHMLERSILAEVDGRYLLGTEGERIYGGKNFLALYSVFESQPSFTVLWGRRVIGSVEFRFVLLAAKPGFSFTLAARAWRVRGIDWQRGLLNVVPTEAGRPPQWEGGAEIWSRDVCEEVRLVLAEDGDDPSWTRRATDRAAQVRHGRGHEAEADSALVPASGGRDWFTFAGARANNLLAAVLQRRLGEKVIANNLRIRFTGDAGASEVAIREARTAAVAALRREDFQAATYAEVYDGRRFNKFQPCLPRHLELAMVAEQIFDVTAARAAVNALAV